MLNAMPRPVVTPERYRELEIIAWQIMQSLPHQNLGECLIIRDLCENALGRWIAGERLPSHEPQKSFAASSDPGNTNVIRLQPAE